MDAFDDLARLEIFGEHPHCACLPGCGDGEPIPERELIAPRELARLENGSDVDHLNRPGLIGCDYLERGSKIERTRQLARDGDVKLLENLRAARSPSTLPEPRHEIPGDLLLPSDADIVGVDQDFCRYEYPGLGAHAARRVREARRHRGGSLSSERRAIADAPIGTDPRRILSSRVLLHPPIALLLALVLQ